jgi:hypothetical protein
MQVSNDKMFREEWIGRDMEESGHVFIWDNRNDCI